MAVTLIIECEKRPRAAAGSGALGFLVRSVLKMCVFMSPGRLSWLHKIELVISNISSPKGGWVGVLGGGAEMVASCQQRMSRVLEIQGDA